MARPREFDEAAVLDLAMRQFWSHGYEATSIRELADGTGITGASLYNAFGDKRSLYRRALDAYIAGSFVDRVARLEGRLPPLEALTAFFDEVVESSLADAEQRGCMLVNTAMELAPKDPDFRDVVQNVLVEIELFFRRSVLAGQKDGSITKSQPAADLARTLLGLHLGLRVLARTRPEKALLKGAVRSVLAMLAA
jgi:TetR/AcrR family transcriptional repressor of nem operon